MAPPCLFGQPEIGKEVELKVTNQRKAFKATRKPTKFWQTVRVSSLRLVQLKEPCKDLGVGGFAALWYLTVGASRRRITEMINFS